MATLEPAASGSNKLPREIMEAILRLLQPKSLGRLKSVSKRLNSLISHPDFIRTHLHHNHTSKVLLTSYEQPEPLLYSVHMSELLSCLNSPPARKPLSMGDIINSNDQLREVLWDPNADPHAKDLAVTELFRLLYSPDNTPTDPPPAPTATPLGIPAPLILGSCNGLLLTEPEYSKLVVMNPTTRELWNVPPSPFPEPERPSFLLYGFCYLPSEDDYKIVSLSYWDRWFSGDRDSVPDCTTDTLLSVYSLRANSWRKLPNTPIPHHRYVHHNTCTAVVLNQTFHWLASDSRIVAFNIATEQFSELRVPDVIANKHSMFCELMAVGGEKLGLLGVSNHELWVMDKYGVAESWTRISSLGHCMQTSGSRNALCLESRWIPISDCDCDHHGYFGNDGAVLYDMDERRCRLVRIVGCPSKFSVGGSYVETLESPKRIITPP